MKKKGLIVVETKLAEPTLTDVLQARRRLRPHLYPVSPRLSDTLSRRYHRDVWLIPECLQRTGSFKFRGALNRMLLHSAAGGGPVVTASSGNHAIGLTTASRITGVEATVFVPNGANASKLAILHGLGANVIVAGSNFDETEDLMYEYADTNGIEIINSFDRDVIAGHATAAIDAIEQLPDLTTLLIPVASGGLLAGCAVVANSAVPDCHVFGVQTSVWPAIYESLRARKLVSVPGGDTLADGLAGNSLRSELPFQIISRLVEKVLLVDEPMILAAVRHALLHEHMVLEGAGASTLAVLIAGALPPGDGPVGVILSGGNSTEALMKRALA